MPRVIFFFADGQTLASLTDGAWRVHDVDSGKLLLTLPPASAKAE